MSNIFLPYYSRPPCKIISSEFREFDDGAGHKATIKYVIYLDKNKREQEAVAQVIWHEKR